jgi:hypothetical protein
MVVVTADLWAVSMVAVTAAAMVACLDELTGDVKATPWVAMRVDV